MRLRLIVLLLLAPLAKGQQQMTHEEQVVRATYARVTFAAQLGMLWHAVELDEGWPGLNDGLVLTKAMNEQVRFDLTDFKVGELKDISTASWTSLIEGPVDTLFIHFVEMPVGFTKDNKTRNFPITYADAAWKPAALSAIDRQEERVRTSLVPTVKEVLRSLRKPNGGGEWKRYASYSVVASLREKSISYRATFLFSPDGQEILPLDYATGMGIASFVKTTMFPSALVDTAFREIPLVQSWILSNEIKGCKTSNQPEVCCDPVMGRCGIASEDLQRSLGTQIDPDMRMFLPSRLPKDKKKKEEKQ
ncbi:MAG TPA: hypothetical protein VE604_00325 [Candidatus Polarisedimenticolia bacterium]|jgi:hypothetical protein|nr:hypothetical protein [Candidatus Polarisedimenticolia bacterium]